MSHIEGETETPELERFRVVAPPGPNGIGAELGVVAAPSGKLAAVYASQIFGRRGEAAALHVISHGLSTAAPRYERPFPHHALRRVDGYSVGQRLAQARKGQMRHV